MSDWRLKISAHKKDLLIALVIFVVTLTTFLISRVHQLADSKYSMVLSQSLLEHGSFALDRYRLPRLEPFARGDYVLDGDIYQLEWVDDHLYYYFPPGSSVLSVPYVALMNAFGISAVNSDGTYSLEGDLKLQASLAALLMAALASIFFFMSRLVLPRRWSVLVALGGALGTQVWSTASRVLWSDTWGIFLLGLVVWMLVAESMGKYRLRPMLLATLLAWMYFVRPTFSIPLLAVSVYILVFHRKLFVWYALTGIIWLAGFIVYSWHNFSHLLPDYYLVNRLTFSQFWEAVAGNLISPSRGLLVYVPIALFITYLLIRYRSDWALPRLIVVSLSVIIAHIIVVSGFAPWYGGHCYGPRYSTGIVPWLLLLGVLALDARLRRRRKDERATDSNFNWRAEWSCGALLLLCSISINALGATSRATAFWNIRPVNVDEQPSRVWDWRHPQFLAAWQSSS